MKDHSYQTITGTSEGFYKEKGSKFIAYAYPVSDRDEVKVHLDQLKKQYFDARHHCYAFVLEGENGQEVRANDDGEPGHSAGDPILGQIRSFGLSNVLVVVVRYFGGTKLGVSGLVYAYKTAAELALSQAKTTTVVIKRTIKLQYPYDKTNEVMRLISELEVEIADQVFEADCLLKGRILPSKYDALKEKVALLDNVILSK